MTDTVKMMLIWRGDFQRKKSRLDKPLVLKAKVTWDSSPMGAVEKSPTKMKKKNKQNKA